ncbi:hypothetical protein DWB67_01150 [Paracoccus sp. JM45]|nr:hypothetical protein DWB67_01150 [Paracoccus sp. JM45]
MPDPKSKTGYKVEETGWRGFKAAKGLDIFDDLERRAVLRKDQDGNPGQSPFTKKQVNTARRYRDIVERHDAGGMKCASLEARLDGSSNSGGEFIDAYLAEGREIRAMQHAIGKGVALAVRRARTSARLNAKTRNIRDRDLVDAICLHGKSFRDVLKVYGWSIKGQNIALLTGALSRTLDRMGWQ